MHRPRSGDRSRRGFLVRSRVNVTGPTRWARIRVLLYARHEDLHLKSASFTPHFPRCRARGGMKSATSAIVMVTIIRIAAIANDTVMSDGDSCTIVASEAAIGMSRIFGVGSIACRSSLTSIKSTTGELDSARGLSPIHFPSLTRRKAEHQGQQRRTSLVRSLCWRSRSVYSSF